MKPTILLINFQDQQKLRKLKMALLPFKLRIKTIEPQDYSQPIGYLAGVKEVSQVQIPSALPFFRECLHLFFQRGTVGKQFFTGGDLMLLEEFHLLDPGIQFPDICPEHRGDPFRLLL